MLLVEVLVILYKITYDAIIIIIGLLVSQIFPLFIVFFPIHTIKVRRTE